MYNGKVTREFFVLKCMFNDLFYKYDFIIALNSGQRNFNPQISTGIKCWHLKLNLNCKIYSDANTSQVSQAASIQNLEYLSA